MARRRPTEPRVPPVGKVLTAARAASADSPGQPVNIMATMATMRGLSKPMGEFAKALFRDDSPILARQRELAILRMTWNCQAVYTFGQHTMYGLSAGLTNDEVYLATRPISNGRWSQVDGAILQAVDDLHIDDCISDGTWLDLEGHFDHSQIMEICTIALWYRLASALANSCGIQLDDGIPGWPAPR
jgi:4-carboxymuconolactone decarboxylase